MKCEVPDAYNFPHSIDVTRINRPYINNMLGASRDRRDILSFIQHVSESVSKTYRGDGTQCHASKINRVYFQTVEGRKPQCLPSLVYIVATRLFYLAAAYLHVRPIYSAVKHIL